MKNLVRYEGKGKGGLRMSVWARKSINTDVSNDKIVDVNDSMPKEVFCFYN